ASRGGGGSGNDPGACGDGFVSVEKGEFSCGGGRMRLRCVLAEDGVVSRGGGFQGRGTGVWCGVVDHQYRWGVGDTETMPGRGAGLVTLLEPQVEVGLAVVHGPLVGLGGVELHTVLVRAGALATLDASGVEQCLCGRLVVPGGAGAERVDPVQLDVGAAVAVVGPT